MLLSTEVKPYQTVEKRGRVGLFQCECGCGQTFFAPIKTRHPRYANKTHRARAYRARARARAAAFEYFEMGHPYTEVYWDTLAAEMNRNRGRS